MRYITQRVDNFKFPFPGGHVKLEGHAIFDTEVKKFVCDEGSLYPWAYKKKLTALAIVSQFNEVGPAGPLAYCEPLKDNS